MGGGAAGFLIVNDLPGDIPEAVANMPEKLMMIEFMDLVKLYDLQDDFNAKHMLLATGSTDDIMLVNGQTDPLVSMDANKWYRWRIAFAALESTAVFTLDDDSCEMQLLAKDGIYLEEAPRAVTSLPLYPAARCDVAVRCTGSIRTVKLTAVSSKFLDQGKPFDGKSSAEIKPCELIVSLIRCSSLSLVFTLDISATNEANDDDLKPFVVNRPCYLVGLKLVCLAQICLMLNSFYHSCWFDAQAPLVLPF